MPKFALIASPLTKKSVPFQWTDESESAFHELKVALSTSPILIYPKFCPGHSLILETDALSTVGLGAVLSLMQDGGTVHPIIAYASRSVDKHEKNYGIRNSVLLV